MSKRNISEYHQLPILDGLELLNAKSHTLDFPFHTHDTFNIALILENTFNIRLDDKDIMVPKGVLSIVRKPSASYILTRLQDQSILRSKKSCTRATNILNLSDSKRHLVSA
ncbi:MAG: hypothetical protein Q8O72_05775 [Bacteroidales bacterium]|nr:hypothetical protein [Bacteroidales bacterium]